MQELTHPTPHTVVTPVGHRITVTYSGGLLERENVIQVIEGEGLPQMGNPVRCRGFTVTKGLLPKRVLGCDEVIPQQVEGFCDCDGHAVPYNNTRSGSLLRCYDYRSFVETCGEVELCGRMSRGDLVVEFDLQSVICSLCLQQGTITN